MEKKILEKAEEELLIDLQKLLKIESVIEEYNPKSSMPFGEKIKKAQIFIEELGKRDGFEVKHHNNHVSYIEIGEGSETLAILVHLDVVPATGKWTYPPFSGIIADGKLYGRGAIDNKGPAMAVYHALKVLKKSNFPFKKKVRLIFGFDEETKMRCISEYLKYEKMPELGFAPDAAFPLIHGEKGILSGFIQGDFSDEIIESYESGTKFNLVPDLAFCTLRKNYEQEFLSFLKENNYRGEYKEGKYFIYGKSAHASTPLKGFNANFPLIEFLNTIAFKSPAVSYLNKYFLYDTKGEKLKIEQHDPNLKDLTLNLAFIHYKDSKFSLGFDIRYPIKDSFPVIEKQFIESLKNYPFLKYQNNSHLPLHYVDLNSDLVKKLMQVYQTITGDLISKPYTIGGGTYARLLKNAVAFGPSFENDLDVVHQIDEHITLERLNLLLNIYYQGICLLCA